MENSGGSKVSRIQYLGTMNVCTKNFNLHQSGGLTNTALHGAMPLAWLKKQGRQREQSSLPRFKPSALASTTHFYHPLNHFTRSLNKRFVMLK